MTTEAKRVYLQNENDEILLPYSAQALEDGAGNVISETYAKNTELNNKLDLNANNLDTAGKALISGLSMPSNKYIDLTLGASGLTYTAPANGWYYVGLENMTSSQYFRFIVLDTNGTYLYSVRQTRPSIASAQNILIPIHKGNILKLEYTTTTYNNFRFIYAEGSK